MSRSEQLKEYAAALSDEELIRRLRSGGLTEEAADVTRQELVSISVNVDEALATTRPVAEHRDLAHAAPFGRGALIWAAFSYSVLVFLFYTAITFRFWSEAPDSFRSKAHPVAHYLMYLLPTLYLVAGVLFVARKKLAIAAYVAHPVLQVALLAYFIGWERAFAKYTGLYAAGELAILALIISYALWLSRRGVLT